VNWGKWFPFLRIGAAVAKLLKKRNRTNVADLLDSVEDAVRGADDDTPSPKQP